jgi:hypothetical protein
MAWQEQRIRVETLSVPSTASTTTIGTAFALPVTYTSMLVVASLESHTGGTLDVYLQDSWDGGTTWYDCAHFAQLTAATAAEVAASLTLSSDILAIGIGTLGTPGVALAVETFRPAPWGPLLRIIAVTGSGTSGASKVQSISFLSTDARG